METPQKDTIIDTDIARAILGLAEAMTNVDESYRRRETFLLRTSLAVTGVLVLCMVLLTFLIMGQQRTASNQLEERIGERMNRSTDELIKSFSVIQTVNIESDVMRLAKKLWEQEQSKKGNDK